MYFKSSSSSFQDKKRCTHLFQSSNAALELVAKFLLCDSFSCHLTTQTKLISCVLKTIAFYISCSHFVTHYEENLLWIPLTSWSARNIFSLQMTKRSFPFHLEKNDIFNNFQIIFSVCRWQKEVFPSTWKKWYFQ